jgi:signal transduction histidine kinase
MLLWALIGMRMRQMRKVLSARFDERLTERTRMARELHDTFLQTLQGSKLVADDALEKSADPVHMRRAMEQLSAWLERAIHEGRAALNSLRTSTTQTNDLAEAFKRAAEESRMQSRMDVFFSVSGHSKEMHPVVRDEVYRIGYEAIRNACLHSNGKRLEVSLRYGKDLAVCVRDNGVGIDPTVAERGKNGHFGLQGMRERAERIGGKLIIVSSPDSGTEVKIVVPAGIVFGKSRVTLLSKIRNVFRRTGLRL